MVGKEIGTHAHCPWCDGRLCAKGKGNEDGPWGDAKKGCGGTEGARPYRYHMEKWKILLATLKEERAAQEKQAESTSQPAARGGKRGRGRKGGRGGRGRRGSSNRAGSVRQTGDGLGKDRPALYRYHEKEVTPSPSPWATTAASSQGTATQTAYIPADEEMESGSLQWDTFEGTIEELTFARLWLDRLKLVPDELHMAQKLIETIRGENRCNQRCSRVLSSKRCACHIAISHCVAQ